MCSYLYVVKRKHEHSGANFNPGISSAFNDFDLQSS